MKKTGITLLFCVLFPVLLCAGDWDADRKSVV